jgi:hypothetical protein
VNAQAVGLIAASKVAPGSTHTSVHCVWGPDKVPTTPVVNDEVKSALSFTHLIPLSS